MFDQLLQDIQRETQRISESEYESVEDLKNEVLNTILPTFEILTKGLMHEFSTVAAAMGEIVDEIDNLGDDNDDDSGLDDALIKLIIDTLSSGVTVLDDLQRQIDIQDDVLRKRASNFIASAQSLCGHLTEELFEDNADLDVVSPIPFTPTEDTNAASEQHQEERDGEDSDS